MKVKRRNKNLSTAEKLEASGGDPNEIVRLLNLAAEAGSAEAHYALGTFYLHGKYVEPHAQLAIDHLRDASDQLHPSALFDLGVTLEQGIIVKRNLKEAFRCYLKAMTVGDHSAVYEVARCFFHGIGTRKDMEIYETLMSVDDVRKTGEKAKR